MKKIWKVLLIVAALLVISFTIASACPPEPKPIPCGDGLITDVASQPVYETSCSWEWVKHTFCTRFGCFDYWAKEKVCTDILVGYTDPVCRVPVGGCMDETALNYDELAEIDAPEMCEYAEVKQGCAFTMYVLQGNGTCSLTRNPAYNDEKGKLPTRFANGGKLTAYGQDECNKCRTTPFKYSGEWTTTCDIPCVDCN